MASLFSAVKNGVTARQAAEHYGLHVSRNGMACCPFHDDKHPSMKVDERYYCFGCQVTGDAIDLTAKLLGMNLKDAAYQLAHDFGISVSEKHIARPSVRSRIAGIQSTRQHIADVQKVLLQYRQLLRYWETMYAPKDKDASWHPLFIEALKQKSRIEFLLDNAFSSDQERAKAFIKDYESEVKEIELLMARFARQDITGNRGDPKFAVAQSQGWYPAKQAELRNGIDEGSLA